MAKRDYKGFMNLDYVHVKNVPAKVDKEFGYLISAQVMKQVECKVAAAILLHPVPISGREVEFFRTILGLPQREFASLFKLSQVAILKWEREKSKRLSLANEIAFRAIMANELGLGVRSSQLVQSLEKSPKRLDVDFEINYEDLADAA
ncbi:MAG: hypothetical protein ABIQ95_13875 [Bdellovibrionia bacterium]